jgi:hypothetical protein
LSVLFWIGAGAGVMASFGLLIGLAPDRRYVFDATSGVLNIGRCYPWQDRETLTTIPFSAIASVGFEYLPDDEAGDTYVVNLRLNDGRNFGLWSVERGDRSGRLLVYYLNSNPDLERLQALTRLRREDRLGRQGPHRDS